MSYKQLITLMLFFAIFFPFDSQAGCYEYQVKKGTKVQTDLVSKIPLEYRSETTPCMMDHQKHSKRTFDELPAEDQKFLNDIIRLRMIKKENLSQVDLDGFVYVYRESLIKAGADPDNLDAPPDPRLASPEETLKTFLHAIQNDDLAVALFCMDPTGARVLNATYKSRGKEKMWHYVKDMWPIEKVQSHPELAEYRTVKKSYSQKIIFVNVLGNWKIAQY